MTKQATARATIVFGIIFLLYACSCFWTLWQHGMFLSVIARMTICFLAALALMSVLYSYAKRHARYDIVDIGWGMSGITIAIVGFLLQHGQKFRWDPQTLVTILIVIWGSRLSWHIYQRFRRSKQEDPRYTELRRAWKHDAAFGTYMRIFVVQAFLILVVSIPVVHINLEVDSRWSVWSVAGALIWLLGFMIEAVADHQLKMHLKREPGTLMTSGLWSVSRHPNYLGELMQWWGLAVIALDTEHGWVGIGGPLALTYLIVFISGLPQAEKRAARKAGWASYKRRVAPLVPGLH